MILNCKLLREVKIKMNNNNLTSHVTEEYDSFYLYLRSGSTNRFLHTNKSNDFSTELLVNFDPNFFMVGLHSIYFTDTFLKEAEIVPIVENEFDEDEQESDKVKVFQHQGLTMQIPKGTLSLQDMMDQFSRDVSRKFSKLVVRSINSEREGKRKTEIEWTGEPEPDKPYMIELNSNAARVLGFKKKQFKEPKKYTSDYDQSIEAYTRLKPDDALSIGLVYYKKVEIDLPELPEAYEKDENDENEEIDILLHQCSQALMSRGYFDISAVVDPDGKYLYVEIMSGSLSLQLPAKLNKLLGLPANYKFTKSDKILMPGQEAPPTPVKELDFVYVLSNIVELSQIGDTMLPILYVHKREDGIKRRHEIVANPVSYVHLKRTLADFIKIQLVNQKGEYIEKSDTETVIVLHFKRF